MGSPIFLGQSAVIAHQDWLNVIGNNLANIDTLGFKAGRLRFGDVIGATTGGITFGNGVAVTGVDTNFSQGSLQITGLDLDLALDGKGFFTLDDGNKNVLTRVGAFALNESKFLVDRATGFRVLDLQGKAIKVDATQFRTDGTETTAVDLVGNLDTATVTSGTFKTSTTVFDSVGNQHTLNITFERNNTSNNQWTATVTSPETGVVFVPPSGGTSAAGNAGDNLDITFKTDGTPPDAALIADNLITVNFGLEAQDITFNFADVLQTAGATNIKEGSKNGTVAITFSNIEIGSAGEVRAVKTDGSSETITDLGISVVDNPDGLKPLGNGLFVVSSTTGAVKLGRAAQNQAGTIRSGALESSNVDLTTELVNLIIAQRGFSTGAKIITTADQVMQETLQLKR
ncbi:MAG: flagellar hook protein FlgE [Candidatus Anammoxibacter sp.]